MSLGINTKSSAEASVGATLTRTLRPIDRPIFITGLGRSGTTIIHTLLSTHTNANWLSLLCAKFPRRPYLNRWLMWALDVPLLNIYLKRRFVPLENYDFWESYFRGFGAPCRDLFASDLDVRTAQSIRKVLSQLLTSRRNRLLIKITGFPRIGFLHALFPDAKFVHVTRDGRAVANSRMRTPFWKGWQGLNLWAGEMPAYYQKEWERHGHSFVALAAIEWKTHLDQMREIRRTRPEINILEIKYEAFCANPVKELRHIAEFCELSWEKSFENQVSDFYVASENSKWQSELTAEQQAILQQVLADQLIDQGYELGLSLESPVMGGS
jgi:omega-hydroxy-beta-dihydromenaquinone-9 sulfotransferase